MLSFASVCKRQNTKCLEFGVVVVVFRMCSLSCMSLSWISCLKCLMDGVLADPGSQCCFNVCIPSTALEYEDCCCPLEVPCDSTLACRQNTDCSDTQVCCNSTDRDCSHRVCAERPAVCEQGADSLPVPVGLFKQLVLFPQGALAAQTCGALSVQSTKISLRRCPAVQMAHAPIQVSFCS